MEKFLADYGLKWIGDDGKHKGQFDEKSIDKELDH